MNVDTVCGKRQGKGKVTNPPAPYRKATLRTRETEARWEPRGRLLDCAPVQLATGAQGMGKGDQRSRRGKIYRGSFGKTRAKDPASKKKKTGTTRR